MPIEQRRRRRTELPPPIFRPGLAAALLKKLQVLITPLVKVGGMGGETPKGQRPPHLAIMATRTAITTKVPDLPIVRDI